MDKMAGCDGWVTIKVFELIFSIFCIIFKRVTDDEANKLFYFLQKVSREWPLLNNVTWEENGAIFTDVAYGGYIIIVTGLIIAQCTGELAYCRKMENFFLVLGALLFISAGSLELAALDSVEERLVDNAAILGVISLVAGLIFILDLLLSSKRRKKTRIVTVKKVGYDKDTQTEDTKLMEVYRSSDMNGNVKNGGLNGGFYPDPFPKMGSKKVPKNGVKILPTSPVMDDSYRIPVTNSNNEYVGTIASPLTPPPVYAPSDLKTQEAKIRSTESFLRSEKGEIPRVRKMPEEENTNNQVFIPPGYVLVPAGRFDLKSQTKPESESRGSTPPGYAKIAVDSKNKKNNSGYVIIPVDQLETKKTEGRKLQSPTVTTTVRTPTGYYYSESAKTTPSPHLRHGVSNMSLSDVPSDLDDSRQSESYSYGDRMRRSAKYSPEYLQMDSKGRKHSPLSDDSSDAKWGFLPKGKVNLAYAEDKDEPDFAASPFQRNSSYRSSRMSDKPKSILRFDQSRSSSKNGLNFPKDVHYDSLDSQKIAEDLRHLKEITKSDLDLARDLEKENEMLKEHLRKEKEEKAKLAKDFKKELKNKEEEAKKTEMAERKKLEERISELEDLRKQLNLEKNLRDFEARKRLEKRIKEIEDEKDRRMSEREEQYFGIIDLKQSHKDSSPVAKTKMSEIEDYFRKETEKSEGAKEINAKLKEKFLEREDKAKEDQELRKVIEEGFHFLDEEEKRKRGDGKKSDSKPPTKPKLMEKKSAPELTSIYQKSIDSFNKKKSDDFSRRWKSTESPAHRSDESDETACSQATDDELRGETPGSASYKSEAQFWLGGEGDIKSSAPTSPRDPGYVLHTVQNWPESKSPSPQNRFQFSAKKAQKLKIEPPKTPSPAEEDDDQEEEAEKKSEEQERVQGRRKGLLIRKVDFPEEPVTEIRRPATVAGSTSTWKKWLQPKQKLQPTKSTPN